jgi:hypothetical protein
LNLLNNNKQNTLTFSNPFLNTSNTISLKVNSSQFNIDSSGNLNLKSNASSQRITSGSNIYYNTGNVGINTTSPLARLTIKMGYSYGNTGGFCIDNADTNTYNLRVFSYVQAGGQVGYKFQVNNISLTNISPKVPKLLIIYMQVDLQME